MTRLLAALAGLVLVLAACGADDGDLAADLLEDEPEVAADDEPEPAPGAAGEELTAVSSTFPLAWLAKEIAPGAEVTFLGAGGADPHDLEMSPGDRAQFETADVVLYMGDLDFQPQVERAVADASGQVVDVRAVVGDRVLIEWDHAHDDGDGHAHDDDDGHAHDDDDDEPGHDDDGDEHGHDDHDDRGRFDPHAWFDVALMAEVTVQIGEAFAAADPDGAETYRANADRVRGELVALGADLDALLSGCRIDTAIVSHEAYAYLLAPRGLAQEGISGAGGHGEASPQRLAELSAKIQDRDIPAVLAEPLHGRADAEALAREAGVDMLDIDPLEIATDEHWERGYPALLREQAERFAAALACEGAA